ncbi:MAG: class I SAM-dependent methyltransferase [Ruoffia tabacinasalis]|uniref:class I SAM-dependent methyltransferase n=1 Tax=unclassified Ruoffia TaxID=2862149 RepID=UPI000ED20BE3|nr:class I SAM-dependent methyltransferase [Aerococcaceae bacterium]
MNHIHKFNQLASHYDSSNNIKMAELATEAIRPFLNDERSEKVVDLGCGTGLVGLELLEDVDSMLFVDGSEKMLEQVELKLAEKSAHNASVRLMDFEKGIQLPEKVDTIIMSLVLHHIPNYQALLASLLEQLNEDGRLLLIEMGKQGHGHGFDMNQLAEEVQTAGFGNVEADMFFENQESSRFLLRATK